MTEATELPDFIEQALATVDSYDDGNPFAWFERPRPPAPGLIARLRRRFATPDGRHRQAADGASQTR